jgi:hypothetical protein
MLKGLHGEGHPALWFLIVRAAYFSFQSSAALWLASVAIASAAAWLLTFRSPFEWPLIGLFLFGRIALVEYSVFARDYGIGMLLMFLFAAGYSRHRDRGIVLGGILFLLANTHVLCVLLVAAFLLFWLIDLLCDSGFQLTPTLKAFLLNAAIATVGVAVCAMTIYPPSADAVPVGSQNGVAPAQIFAAIFQPARLFSELVVNKQLETAVLGPVGSTVISFIMFLSLFGLLRRPAAFVAASAALIAFSLFFTVVFPGSYRHEALWLVFLASMYWIVREQNFQLKLRPPAACKSLVGHAVVVGSISMVLLLAIQLPRGLHALVEVAFDYPPQSRSRDLGKFISGRPDLKDAIIIADPDSLLEAIPYYIQNDTYLIRDQRFGSVVSYRNSALLIIDLDHILEVARKLNLEQHRPVLILLAQRLDPASPALSIIEGYNWRLNITPNQVNRFLSLTKMLVRFPPAKSDESFDVYLYSPP